MKKKATIAAIVLAVLAGLGLSCDDGEEEKPVVDVSKGIILENTGDYSGYHVLSPADGSVIYNYSTGQWGGYWAVAAYDKNDELYVGSGDQVQILDAHGQLIWAVDCNESFNMADIWVNRNDGSFWWQRIPGNYNNLYHYKKGQADPIGKANSEMPVTAADINPKDGSLWVVSNYNTKAKQYNPHGNLLREIDLGSKPDDIKIDDNGNIWISYTVFVAKYDSALHEKKRVMLTNQTEPKRLAIDEHSGAIWVVGPTGTERITGGGQTEFYLNGVGRGWSEGISPGVVFAGDHSFWLLNPVLGTITRIAKEGHVTFAIATKSRYITAFSTAG